VARRVKSQFVQRSTGEAEPRCLHRVLVADDRNVAVLCEGVANCGHISGGNILELLAASGLVCVVQVCLQLVGEGLGDRTPSVPCPMGELAGFG